MANLAALLEKEASAEIEAILADAKHRAAEIATQAEEEASSMIAQRASSLEAQYVAGLVRAKSSAELEASSLKLWAQNRSVEAVFKQVEAELRSVIEDPQRYREVLKALLDEALDATGGAERVIVNPADAGLVALQGVEVDTDPGIFGGVRVVSKAGSVVVENTLFGRLDALRGELSSEISRILLPDSDSP